MGVASNFIPHRRGLLTLGAVALLARNVRASGRDDSAQLRAFVRERMARDSLTGVSAAILKDGQVTWMESFGLANRDRRIAMTPQTPVGIGSITKTFTALALQQLHSRGRIDLDAPLHRLLPDFRIGMRGFDRDALTLRAIATHTSGLPTSVFRNIELERARYVDVPALLADCDMAACPGTVGLYSNIGYSLLGNAIRVSSGQDYPVYVRDHILRPLGMASSGFAGEQALPTPSLNYYLDGRAAAPFELRDQPAGGLYASVEDLIRYARGVIAAWYGDAPRLLSRRAAQEMFTVQNAHIPIETNKKGFGWFMFQDGARFAMYHAGSTIFSNAALLVLPEQRAAAAIVVNTVGGDRLAQEFAFDVLERHGIAPSSIRPAPHLAPIDAEAVEIAAPSAQLDRHVGDYAQKNLYLTVERVGSELRVRGDGKPVTLRPLSNGAFRTYADGGSRVTDEEHRFVDVGPYHVFFRRTPNGEFALGYKATPSVVDVAPRLGRYTHFGYQMAGAEQILAAHVELVEARLPMLRLSYNTGDYRYPLLFETDVHAITGGLGPELTGQSVRLADEGKTLIYAGLTFQRERSSD